MKKDKFWLWLAERLPHKLVYYATIRLFAYATTGLYSDTIVPELTVMEALARWDIKEERNGG